MNRVFLLSLLLLALAAGCPALAQSPIIVPSAPGVVTIDASRLNTVITLDAPWRFSATDNPAFADPGVDDSTWPLLTPIVGQRLASAHVPNLSNGRCWARLHLHIVNATGPLAITISTRDGTQFALFANGREIGRSKGFTSSTKYFEAPFRLELPTAQDLVLSLHLVHPGAGPVRYFLLENVQIGQSQAVGDQSDLARYATFESDWFTYAALGTIYLACVPFSIALLLAQRRRPEYLWFAVFCVLNAVFYGGFPSIYLGSVTAAPWAIDSVYFAQALSQIAALEFVAAIAESRRGVIFRIVQAACLVSPFLLVYHEYRAVAVSDAVLSIGWLSLVCYLLGSAYRRGSKECAFLAVPLISLQLSALFVQAESQFPDRFGELWQGHLGGIGFRGPDVGALLIIAGVVAVVLYRFIRVSESEQSAAAEFEAARTVQQLLIPATQPETPGFRVESVYLPAREVGGDFFLILPSDDSTDHSLLAIMGDVSGKGLQAAMVVSTIMGGLRIQLSRQPAEVLAQLNRLLVGHVSGFATCCVALIHPDGAVQIANAGNPAPYSNGEEVPTLPGLPLGLAPGIVYDETTYTLTPAASLTFVSDGVIEATAVRNRELFGFDRTRDISQQSADAIAAAVVSFSAGGPQGDDITVLTLSRM